MSLKIISPTTLYLGSATSGSGGGSGNVPIKTFEELGITKVTNQDTFVDLALEIQSLGLPTKTTIYGEVRNLPMPKGVGNAEVKVEILDTKSNGKQVMLFTLYSSDTEPYQWTFVYYQPNYESHNQSWIWNDGSSAKLYDTKVLSQAIADKGWSFLCKDSHHDLAKSEVPTLYADLKEKFDNIPQQPSAMQQGISAGSAWGGMGISIDNSNKVYVAPENGLYDIDAIDLDSGSLSQIYSTKTRNVYAGENILLIVNNDGVLQKVNKHDTTQVTNLVDISSYNPTWRLIQLGPTIFIKPYDCYDKIYMIDDFDDAQLVTINFTNTIFDFGFDNGNFYLLTSTGVMRGEDIENESSFSLVYSDTGYSGGCFLCAKNGLVCWVKTRGSGIQYTTDNFENIITSDIHIDFVSSYTYSLPEIFGRDLYTTYDNSVSYVINFSDSLTVTTLNFGYVKICGNNDYIVFQTTNKIMFSGNVKISYTDTYIINGSTKTINYYLDEATKTKIVTDVTNLDDVYNFLGYLPYFYLNTSQEILTLPRDKRLYTMMYVGDNYQDTTTGITGNATRGLPQSNIVTDTSSTAISFSSSSKVQPNTDYQFGTLATLTLGSGSVLDSQLGTTIRFMSGASGSETSITDNSGISWVDGATPVPSASKMCLIFIWNNIGFYKEW